MMKIVGRRSRVCALMLKLRAQTCAQHHISSIGCQTAEPIGAQLRTNTARPARANFLAASHIQHRRPNGWDDGAPNWYKHSLGQWAEVMGVENRECTLMLALQTQMCGHSNVRAATHIQQHISIIGGQTARPIGPTIGTNTHLEYAIKIGAIVSAH
jgi:hypothetical protein